MIMSDSKFPHKNNWLYHPSKLLMYIKYINNNLVTSTNLFFISVNVNNKLLYLMFYANNEDNDPLQK